MEKTYTYDARESELIVDTVGGCRSRKRKVFLLEAKEPSVKVGFVQGAAKGLNMERYKRSNI